MSYRRKPNEVQTNKKLYIRHIKRLQNIKEGNSPVHRSLLKQRKHIQYLLKKSHQIHQIGWRNQLRRRQKTQALTQRYQFQNIQSVVKRQMSTKILRVPSKVKPDNFHIEQENSRIVNRLLNIKSDLRSTMLPVPTYRPPKHRTVEEDFSDIYQHSRLHIQKKNKVHLKLAKNKAKVKFEMRFLQTSKIAELLRQDALVSLRLVGSTAIKQSNIMRLRQLMQSQVFVEAQEADFLIQLLEKVGSQDLSRLQFILRQSDLQGHKQKWIRKEMLDKKGRELGTVEFKVKKYKKSTKSITEAQVLIQKGQVRQ